MKNTKKLIGFLIISFFSFPRLFSQPYTNEIDPLRGLYINNFVNYMIPPVNGSIFDPGHSILGVDKNHDGIFEKEKALLEYCRDHHITLLVIYDLNRVFTRNIMVWNENDQRDEDLEEHLCRFMNDARTNYCITQFAATGQTASYFDRVSDYNQSFEAPTPPFDFVNSRLSNAQLSPVLSLAQLSLSPSDENYHLSESVKFYLRAGTFGTNCSEAFNILHMEYEFWQDDNDDFTDAIDDTPNFNSPNGTDIIINDACNTYNSLNTYSNGGNLCNEHVYPKWQQAKYDLVFVPTINAIREVKKVLNSGLTHMDPLYVKSQAYLHSIFTLTVQQDYTLYFDGIPDQSSVLNDEQRYLFDLGGTIGDQVPTNSAQIHPDFEMLPNIDKPMMAEFNPVNTQTQTASFSDLDYSVYEYSSIYPISYLQNNTDFNPIFNAESIANNGYDDYWGAWFKWNSNNNLFEVERKHYDAWKNKLHISGRNLTDIGRNDVHRGGAVWYAKSQMLGIHPTNYILPDYFS